MLCFSWKTCLKEIKDLFPSCTLVPPSIVLTWLMSDMVLGMCCCCFFSPFYPLSLYLCLCFGCTCISYRCLVVIFFFVFFLRSLCIYSLCGLLLFPCNFMFDALFSLCVCVYEFVYCFVCFFLGKQNFHFMRLHEKWSYFSWIILCFGRTSLQKKIHNFRLNCECTVFDLK